MASVGDHLGLAAATAAVCVAPWLVRNYLVFDRPVFIRDNLGVELRAGQSARQQRDCGARNVHPDQSAYELGPRRLRWAKPSTPGSPDRMR